MIARDTDSTSRRACGFVLALLTILAAACPATRRESLQRVAKDWAETIRASQVLPVYPLTEDLQPGDLFLVQKTVDEQHHEYERGGFLTLDNHIGRLDPSGYERFYEGSFGLGSEEKPLPQAGIENTPAWKNAPAVAFPTYTFSSGAGGGLDVALPLSGIPVALSLLGARSSSGTVTIAEARTYGVDAESLDLDVRDWAAQHRGFLANFGSRDGRNYLRVVCRVFLTGRVSISVQSTDAFDADAAARPPSPAALLSGEAVLKTAPGQETVAGEYAARIQSLNDVLAKQRSEGPTPLGGSLRVSAASARSISLEETFERPLVIGYLGFDMAILEGGDLGPPIPTQAVLENRARPASEAFLSSDQASYERALRKVRGLDAAFYADCLSALDEELARDYSPEPDRAYPEFTRRLRRWRNEPEEASLKHARLRVATGILLDQLSHRSD